MSDFIRVIAKDIAYEGRKSFILDSLPLDL
jgi:hypothetical protein